MTAGIRDQQRDRLALARDHDFGVRHGRQTVGPMQRSGDRSRCVEQMHDQRDLLPVVFDPRRGAAAESVALIGRGDDHHALLKCIAAGELHRAIRIGRECPLRLGIFDLLGEHARTGNHRDAVTGHHSHGQVAEPGQPDRHFRAFAGAHRSFGLPDSPSGHVLDGDRELARVDNRQPEPAIVARDHRLVLNALRNRFTRFFAGCVFAADGPERV